MSMVINWEDVDYVAGFKNANNKIETNERFPLVSALIIGEFINFGKEEIAAYERSAK